MCGGWVRRLGPTLVARRAAIKQACGSLFRQSFENKHNTSPVTLSFSPPPWPFEIRWHYWPDGMGVWICILLVVNSTAQNVFVSLRSSNARIFQAMVFRPPHYWSAAGFGPIGYELDEID
jgi:hypothetical protein